VGLWEPRNTTLKQEKWQSDGQGVETCCTTTWVSGTASLVASALSWRRGQFANGVLNRATAAPAGKMRCTWAPLLPVTTERDDVAAQVSNRVAPSCSSPLLENPRNAMKLGTPRSAAQYFNLAEVLLLLKKEF